MHAFGGKTPRAFRTLLLVGAVCLALVVSCRAEIASNDTPLDTLGRQENELSLEEVRKALVDELLDDLATRALVLRDSVVRQPFDDDWNTRPGDRTKKGHSGFTGSRQLTNLASGFNKKSTSDDSGLWGAFAEDKRGRSMFNSGLTNLKSGFTKKRSDDAGEENEFKRGRSLFSSRLTNLASGFNKRSDEEAGFAGEAKRGRTSFSGAKQLTHLSSGFNKRGDGEENWDDKRGRTAFSGARRLTNLSSGFKRDGNFNVGPMVHIPSGFEEKRAAGTNNVDSF